MDTLVKNLLETQTKEKIQKPNCQTRSGRSLLAFYLQTKFKQIINHDKKSEKQLILDYKKDFLDNFTNRLINRPEDKILIALTGESASGKSTICKQIAKCVEELNLPVTILTADNYFNDISELIKKFGNFDLLRDAGYDVDSPENFYLDLLREDISKLQKGKDVLTPEYLVNGTGISKPESILVKSNKIIIVEGMCSIYEKVQDIFDIKIYIDLDDEERKRRFMNRAISRNQDSENAQKHWDYILEAGKKYIKPNKKNCEIVINGECNLDYFSHMVEYINLITNNFSE
ncbi:AAA family ATPase [bacterium]|nr:AAA family ATPase [bacterium]